MYVFDSNTLAKLPMVKGVSGIITGGYDKSSILQGYSDYLSSLNVEVIYNGWDADEFPNARGNISYQHDDEANSFRIVCQSRPMQTTWVKLLYFVMHGVGHGIQHRNQHNSALEIQINAASDLLPHFPMEAPFGNGTFGDAFTTYECEASALGWSSLKEYLTETGSSAEEMELLRFLLNLYAWTDHNFHRRSICDVRGFTHNTREWGAEFGFAFASLLSPQLQAIKSGVIPPESALAAIQALELIVIGTDGQFRAISDGQEKALALLYGIWELGLGKAF